jgi:iron complex outermembrane receptor protein
VRPSTPLTLTASVGYLDAKYKEFNDGRRAPSFSCNPTGTKITCKPAFAPPLTMRIGADYRIPLGEASLSFGGDVRFVDKQYLSVDNRPGLTEDGYLLGNVYAQVDYDRFYLRGMVKNVGNALYKTDGQEFSSVGNIQTVYYGDPRTWNLTLGVRFDARDPGAPSTLLSSLGGGAPTAHAKAGSRAPASGLSSRVTVERF